MPHKRNPVLTENLTGLARMVRSYAMPAMEDVALWHERDISHSSVERFIGPDATITLDFALARLTSVIDKLLVYPERMQKNLDRMGGLVHSQRVLLALTQAGLSREDSYALVQRNAMKVWESDGAAVAARPAQGRSGGHRAPLRRASSMRCSTSTITSSTSTRSSTRVFGGRLTASAASFSCASALRAMLAGIDRGADGQFEDIGQRGRRRPRAEGAHPAGRLSARAVARLDRASRVRERPPSARRIACHPDRRAARPNSSMRRRCTILRNLFSRLSGTTGIARAYGVRLTDEPELFRHRLPAQRRPRDPRSGAVERRPFRRSVRDCRRPDRRAWQQPGPGAARRRGAAHARADRLRSGDPDLRRRKRASEQHAACRSPGANATLSDDLPGDVHRRRGAAGPDLSRAETTTCAIAAALLRAPAAEAEDRARRARRSRRRMRVPVRTADGESASFAATADTARAKPRAPRGRRTVRADVRDAARDRPAAGAT